MVTSDLTTNARRSTLRYYKTLVVFVIQVCHGVVDCSHKNIIFRLYIKNMRNKANWINVIAPGISSSSSAMGAVCTGLSSPLDFDKVDASHLKLSRFSGPSWLRMLGNISVIASNTISIQIQCSRRKHPLCKFRLTGTPLLMTS